jgi:hypothetical protein
MSVALGESMRISVYVKQREARHVAFRTDMGGTGYANGYAYFNLTTGAVASISGSITAATIEAIGSAGWYRITATAAGNLTVSGANWGILLCNPAGQAFYQGDNASGIYVWGAQLHNAAADSTYLSTESGVAEYRGMNGRRVLNMDAARYMVSSGTVAEAAGTIFLVFRPHSLAHTDYHTQLIYDSNSNYRINYNTNDLSAVDWTTGGAGDTLLLTDQVVAGANIFEFWYDASSGNARINGATTITDSSVSAANTLDAVNIGWNRSTLFCAADFCEIMIFDRALTSTERGAIYNYLYAKWIAQEIQALIPIYLFEAWFGGTALRYWSGDGDLVWDGETWLGNGVFMGLSSLRENEQLEADGLDVILAGVPAEIVSLVLTYAQHNAAGKVYLGFMQPGRAVIDDPIVLFSGTLDVPKISDGPTQLTISLTYESTLILLKEAKDLRYTDAQQKQMFPGDKGFEFVEQIDQWSAYWGKTKAQIEAEKKQKKKKKSSK